MFERFSDLAQKTLQLANEESRRFNHDYIGTEHLLLGLVRIGSCVTALANLGINLRSVTPEIERMMLPGRAAMHVGKRPFTPRAKGVVEYANAEARRFNHDIDIEHLLLGLLHEEDGVAAQVLINAGISPEDVRTKLLSLLGQQPQTGIVDLARRPPPLPAEVVEEVEEAQQTGQKAPVKLDLDAAFARAVDVVQSLDTVMPLVTETAPAAPSVNLANFANVAGWITPLQASELLGYLSPTPRRFSHWVQLRNDVRAYKPWVLWLVGAGLIALGVFLLSRQPPVHHPEWASPWLALGSILFGGHLLLNWFYAFISAVHWVRTTSVNVGVIRTLKIHPYWRDMALADAVRADGAVVELTMPRVVAEEMLKLHGECEVLFHERPWSFAKRHCGFGIAARPVVPEWRQATETVLHWTGFNQKKRQEFEQIAQNVGYSNDAVFFVLSALAEAARQLPGGGQELSITDTSAGTCDVTAQGLCEFIPKHASLMLGNRTHASRVLSAWGLRTGKDVGAIVAACVEAGWLKSEPGRTSEDFEKIDLLMPSLGGLWRRHRPATRKLQTQSQRKDAATRRHKVIIFCLRLCFTIGVTAGYVLWSERLTAEERPLVGRWYGIRDDQGAELTVIEISADRSLVLLKFRGGGQVEATERTRPLRWAVHDEKLILSPGFRSILDRLARAFWPRPQDALKFSGFRMPDPDTLETNRVFRRVPAGIVSYADLFPP